NTIGKSKFWNSTAIFIQWDDWGGLYDHVPPPYVGHDGLGFRVPLITVAICETRLRFARAIRNRERAALRGGPLRPGSTRCCRPARDVAGSGLLRFFRTPPRV